MSSGVQKEVGRQGLIIGAGITVIGLALAYVGYSWINSESAGPTRLSPVAKGGSSETEESSRYKKTLNEYNTKEAQSAAQKGGTYISVLSTTQTPVTTEKEEQFPKQEPPPPQTTPVYSPQAQAASRGLNEQQTEMLRDQMNTLLQAWAPASHSSAKASEEGEQLMAALLTPSNDARPQAVANARPKAQVVVEPYALVPAILVTGIDTDENSVVSAYVPSGPYAGAEVFAMGYKRLNTTVDMTFTAMQWKGRAYKVTAKPVDLDTGRTTLSGEVNNRYFERIILPAIAGGIGNTGQLYARANSDTVITPQGGAVQSFQSPSGAAVAGSFVSGMGIQAGQVLANDAANTPQKQVVVPAKTTIGIRFIGPVLSTDDVAVEASPTAPAAAKPLAQGIEATGIPASAPNPQRVQAMPQMPAIGMQAPGVVSYGAYPAQVQQPFVGAN
ncbi:hypothetical protein HMPREF3069_05050 [Achromobacter xylosoxidans]|uniref:conjugal transfer protein TraO n=1 Tax=Alcaligenes xylosoxydans xylosoxydans TaxID=85698 RepID=UPI0008A1A295|nr:conjugal transfer protein TraO [Achromobacter xylosoxidans]OFS61660.1 hypothetical protein HMPREF3069_05050 [Achromobacter xylosoxidans]